MEYFQEISLLRDLSVPILGKGAPSSIESLDLLELRAKGLTGKDINSKKNKPKNKLKI